MKAVGENPLDEKIFQVKEDAIQCYTNRFPAGTSLAAFRNPHNSPNNILHLHNIHSDIISKYFPQLGDNVIIINLIGTDAQARGSGFDEDSDFILVTDHKEMSTLAKEAYINYPTIINKVDELKSSEYHFRLEDFADMDNKIADAQTSIGTSTDTAQLALSYYYDEGMNNRELEEIFIILSVIGQISIDLAKKEFDLDVVHEIKRLKNSECMKGKPVPQFFANTKKRRNNKDFAKVEKMDCPMDIMANLIEKNIIGYAGRESHEPIRKLLNKSSNEKVNRYKCNKVIEEAKKYNDAVKALETDGFSRSTDKLSAYIDLLDARDEKVPEELYQQQIDNNNASIQKQYALREEKLKEQGLYDVGSERYQDLAEDISKADEEILKLRKDNEDLKDSIYELRISNLEKTIQGYSDLEDELKDMRDLLNDDAFLDKNGGITDEGLAQIALLSQSLGNAKKTIADYTTGLQKLKELYENGIISLDEYNDKSAEYRKGIREATSDVKSYQDSLTSLYTDALKAEVDALDKLIDKRKKALEAKEDYYNYDKKIRSQQKDVDTIKAQIAALTGVKSLLH